jgi:uncharacterized membrane protein YqjE
MTEPTPSFTERLRQLAMQVIELAQVRARLLSVELSLEVRRLLGSVVWALLAAAFATFAIVMTVVALLMAFWEQRVWIAGGLALLFALVSLWSLWQVRRRLSRLDELLGSSARELSLDREALVRQSGTFREGIIAELNVLDERAHGILKGTALARLGVLLLMVLRRVLKARRSN